MKKVIILLSLLSWITLGVQGQNCCTGATATPQSNISAGSSVDYSDIGIDFNRTRVDESNPSQYKLTTIIQNKNGNNSSRETVAIIQLPGETNVLSFRQADINPLKLVKIVQCGGILICNIDNLDPSTGRWNLAQTEVSIEVVTTRPTKRNAICQANFGIHTFSKSPDTYLDNNFWQWHTDTERAISCQDERCQFPDLIITQSSWDEATKTLKVTVQNNGVTPSSKFLVYFDAEGADIHNNPICQQSATVSELSVGESKELSVNFSNASCRNGVTPLPTSVTQFSIKVDAKGYVKECNETNNGVVVNR